MIRDNQNRRGATDEISQVLGSDAYYIRHYDKQLRDLILGKHSCDLIPVSRFYPMLDPRVVVDFEPIKPDKMYCEEKRRFFNGKGYIYIPIFMGETLTKEQFSLRYKEEKENLARGYREKMEDEAMDIEPDLPMFSDAQFMAQIEAQALQIVRDMGLRGAAKNKRLRREKERLLREAATNARMGPAKGGQEPTISSR